jgi:DNA-directed RNA polymerase specialized sigma24 family protein
MYREAILLVAFEGLKPIDAALVCGITPEAMRQRISRARALIDKHLQEAGAGPAVSLKAVTT